MVKFGPSVFYLFIPSIEYSVIQFSIFQSSGFGLMDQLEMNFQYDFVKYALVSSVETRAPKIYIYISTEILL